ncbi:hypothetical protein DFH08DRAFT_329173 [Mycena albidolilacea]|uniref:Uncharacterized protein n=1 Tax=Mycena albidolilacea TaxID=1033008 RepID=A0AAD7AMI7_9AGAR|nr:hypothetical protein DFH08DRAFT_329173 [Mycena albidolilacea]
MCEFDACERDTAILRAHAPFVLPPPVRPSLLPAWPERCVQLPALPAARPAFCSCTTRNTMRSANMRPLFSCLMGPAPRTSPHVRYIARTPYHAHALSTRPPRTSYTTGSRRCPSSTRAPTGTTTILSGDTPERSPRAPTRTRTHRTGDVQHQPMRPFPVHSTIAYTAFLASCHSPNYHSHERPRAQRLRSLFFIASPELRRLRHRPPLPRAIVNAGAPPHARRPAFDTGSQTRGATGMCSARRRPHRKHQEAIVAGARRPSAAQLPVRLPCGTSHRATNPLLRDCDTTSCALERSRRRTAPTHSTPRRCAPQPGSIPPVARAACGAHIPRPHVAFVSSALCDRLPPSPLDGCACRVLQHYPQHVPRLQRAPRSFLIAGAVFVAFSCATTTVFTARHAAAYIPNTTPTSTASAPAAFHRARRVRRLPARPAHPQRRPNPPLKTRPGTHHEHGAHAMHVAYPCPATVFSAALPSAQRQVLSHSASMPRTTSVRSTRCSCSPSPTPFRPVPARTHHLQRGSALTARRTGCTYLGTVPSTTCVRHGHSRPSLLRPWTVQILSAVLPPNTRAPCRQRQRPRAALHALTTSILSASKRPRKCTDARRRHTAALH